MKRSDFIENLFPGYFALVMATGIVSIATHALDMGVLPRALFAANVLFFAVLCVLTALRLFLFPKRFFADMTDHGRGPGFFTLVAGTCVLGTQLVLLTGLDRAALWLWAAAFFAWFVVMYVFFTAATVRSVKPTLEKGINGAWLLAIVSTQSLSILGVLLTRSELAGQRVAVLFACLCLFLLGGMLYFLIMSIIFHRLLFVNVEAKALTPPYWINMGAVAITTLAGTTIVAVADEWAFLASIVPFLKGFTLFFWATCTWWIPMLLLLGAWRHLYKKEPIVYDPQYWGIVFPLGMYVTCTYKMAQVFGFDFLMPVPRVFVFVALAAWTAAFAGMAVHLVRSVCTKHNDSPIPRA